MCVGVFELLKAQAEQVAKPPKASKGHRSGVSDLLKGSRAAGEPAPTASDAEAMIELR